MRTITMIAAATVVAATQAQAGSLGTIPLDPERYVTGDLDAPGPQKWTLNLRRGGYYAVSAAGGPGSLSVHAAGGKTLASVAMISDEGSHGFSFKAPYTGSYVVQVACDSSTGECPGRYGLTAMPDCPGDASSACRIAVGTALRGLSLFGFEDVDWRGARLAAGRAYHATAGSGFAEADALCLAILDQDGREVVAESCANSPDLAFTPAASGTYFLRTRQGDGVAPGIYSLAVSQAH
jgi:hypothetical protein